MLAKNYTQHLKSCKGVPISVCEFCKQEFSSASNKSKHRKKCDKNPLVGPVQVCALTFGQTENVESLHVRMEYDERIQNISDRFVDLLDLVFFNKNLPENQLVRKSTKKSNFIEFRHNDHWKPEAYLVGITKLIHHLAVLTSKIYNKPSMTDDLFSKWIDMYIPMRGGTVLPDLLYSCTQRGPLDEQTILNRHTLPPLTYTPLQWDAFMKDVRSDYNKQGVSVLSLYVFRKMKASYIEDIQTRAAEHGITHFYKGRDGDPLFCHFEETLF